MLFFICLTQIVYFSLIVRHVWIVRRLVNSDTSVVFVTCFILDERTQIIRIEEEGQKERCEQIVFHKETKVQDVINGLSMMKRDSAIIYESKGTSKIDQNSNKIASPDTMMAVVGGQNLHGDQI